MRTIKEILHEKRKATEYHIKQLQHEGKQSVRYTAMMPDIPFLLLGLISDIGWLTHLIAGMDVGYEPEQHEQRDPDLVHGGCGL